MITTFVRFAIIAVSLSIGVSVCAANNNKGSNGKAGAHPAPAPTPNPFLHNKYGNHYPGSNGPIGNCTKPSIKSGNDNANGNANGNKNGNTNKNTNKNTINNSNDISIKLNVGKTGTGNRNNGGFDGTLSSGFGGGFPNNGFGGGYTAGSYSPAGGSSTYAPSYDFSVHGVAPLGVAGIVGAVGLPPVPNIGFDENDPNTAWVTLELPHEDSDVWLNGAKMPQKGLIRKYVTPPLEKDKIYTYEIKVQWPDKGRAKGVKLNYATTLQFKAGDEILHKIPEEGDGKAAAPVPNKVQNPQDEEKLMNQRLSWAKTLLNEGKKDKARERLREIVEKSPDSTAGKEAKELLGKIN